MPLQLPNLDDRRYNDLVAEALTLIPAYSPEWTNHNPSDPGITLVELFAYLTDMLLYRLNRVTDDNLSKFLKLLNGPDWVEPQNADLREEIRQAVLGIRERYRAVTKEDYEFLSTESFNQWLKSTQSATLLVARAHCVPQKNLEGGTEAERLKLRPEHVSVAIVPANGGSNPNPQPSADQISALFSFLDDRRMLTTRLHVTGPFYVHVVVELVIARNSDAPEKDVVMGIRESLAKFLNPLPSPNGEEWPFGRDVFVSDLYDVLEQVRGVDFITDIMLNSRCTPGDDKCVVAEPIWHEEGGLVGLRVQEHHLPVFDSADIVVAAGTAFIIVNLAVSAKAAAGADGRLLKSTIKLTLRSLLHPGLGGPSPAATQATKIYVSDLQAAIRKMDGVLNPLIDLNCVPAKARQIDSDRGGEFFIQVEAGQVVDWRVQIELS